MKALKKLEYEAIKQLRVNYHVELHALEMKYQQLFVPLNQQVELLVSAYKFHGSNFLVASPSWTRATSL